MSAENETGSFEIHVFVEHPDPPAEKVEAAPPPLPRP